MPVVSSIYTAAVKSLALQEREAVSVGPAGIAEDRRFHLIDGGGRLLTQRQRPQLARVLAGFDVQADRLTLTFPDGPELSGTVQLGEAVRTPVWGRLVPGRVVEGQWNDALSSLCRGPVRLVKTDDVGLSFDEFPVSVLSQASIDLFGRLAEGIKLFEARRFRPNFLIDGCSPHAEDGWLGGVIAIGRELRLRLVAPDPRCAITTIDPDTGERDFDVPRMLLTYRPASRAPYFGVYGVVDRPGVVRLGDEVEVVVPPERR